MITIHYDPQFGQAIADGQATTYVDNTIYAHSDPDVTNVVRSVANASVIQEFRLRVLKDEIKPEEVRFEFRNQPITINEYAVLSDWPKGFADLDDRHTREIVTLAMKKRIADREKGKA